ncbi:MAG TPA: hypothetical protein VMT95_07770 [Candidatus Binatia bacterium]|nr:hypothetical protein [Candidatus Binatia bacterium]
MSVIVGVPPLGILPNPDVRGIDARPIGERHADAGPAVLYGVAPSGGSTGDYGTVYSVAP